MKPILTLITHLFLYQTHKYFGKLYLKICNSEFSDYFSYDLVLMRRLLLCIFAYMFSVMLISPLYHACLCCGE
jgi:hypothetical protein